MCPGHPGHVPSALRALSRRCRRHLGLVYRDSFSWKTRVLLPSSRTAVPANLHGLGRGCPDSLGHGDAPSFAPAFCCTLSSGEAERLHLCPFMGNHGQCHMKAMQPRSRPPDYRDTVFTGIVAASFFQRNQLASKQVSICDSLPLPPSSPLSAWLAGDGNGEVGVSLKSSPN